MILKAIFHKLPFNIKTKSQFLRWKMSETSSPNTFLSKINEEQMFLIASVVFLIFRAKSTFSFLWQMETFVIIIFFVFPFHWPSSLLRKAIINSFYAFVKLIYYNEWRWVMLNSWLKEHTKEGTFLSLFSFSSSFWKVRIMWYWRTDRSIHIIIILPFQFFNINNSKICLTTFFLLLSATRRKFSIFCGALLDEKKDFPVIFNSWIKRLKNYKDVTMNSNWIINERRSEMEGRKKSRPFDQKEFFLFIYSIFVRVQGFLGLSFTIFLWVWCLDVIKGQLTGNYDAITLMMFNMKGHFLCLFLGWIHFRFISYIICRFIIIARKNIFARMFHWTSICGINLWRVNVRGVVILGAIQILRNAKISIYGPPSSM